MGVVCGDTCRFNRSLVGAILLGNDPRGVYAAGRRDSRLQVDLPPAKLGKGEWLLVGEGAVLKMEVGGAVRIPGDKLRGVLAAAGDPVHINAELHGRRIAVFGQQVNALLPTAEVEELPVVVVIAERDPARSFRKAPALLNVSADSR